MDATVENGHTKPFFPKSGWNSLTYSSTYFGNTWNFQGKKWTEIESKYNL